MIKLTIDAHCDVGCKRSNNEDMILLQSSTLRDDSLAFSIDIDDSLLFVAAVADGMGGHNAGEVASEMVLESLNRLLLSFPENLSEEALKTALNAWTLQIHQEVTRAGSENPQQDGMGATLAGIILYHQALYLFWAGDSRIYRLRDGILRQLSVDHSLREMTKDPEAPANVICNAIGGGGEKVFLSIETTLFFEDDEFII